MFGIGVPELVMILIIGLVIFGPGKLPEIGSSVGRSMKEFRQAMAGQDAICNVAFYTDFSDDDTEYKVPRYQSIYNVTYYSDEV